jgi:hypothetical protein
MRWLMIALLVSLAALLLAAAGLARHIWLQRSHLGENAAAGKLTAKDAQAAGDEIDHEIEL